MSTAKGIVAGDIIARCESEPELVDWTVVGVTYHIQTDRLGDHDWQISGPETPITVQLTLEREGGLAPARYTGEGNNYVRDVLTETRTAWLLVDAELSLSRAVT